MLAQYFPAFSSASALIACVGSIMELKLEVLQHLPYSSDLAPSDFFLFPNLKKWLGGRRFTSSEEVIAQTDAYFAFLSFSKDLLNGHRIIVWVNWVINKSEKYRRL